MNVSLEGDYSFKRIISNNLKRQCPVKLLVCFKSGTKSNLQRKHRNNGEVVYLCHSLERCIQARKQRVKIRNLL